MKTVLRQSLSLFLAFILAFSPLTAAAEGNFEDTAETEILEEIQETTGETEATVPEETEVTEAPETEPEETESVEPEPEETEPAETEPEETEAPEEEAEEIPDAEAMAGSLSGKCGEHLTWEIRDDTLTIRGTGEMTDFAARDGAPWYALEDKYHHIVIEEGVVTIGSFAFVRESSPEDSIRLPSTLKQCNTGSFAYRSHSYNWKVYVPSMEVWCAIQFEQQGNPLQAGTLYVNEKLCYQVAIPDSVTSLSATFIECSIQSVIVPASVRKMDQVFSGGLRSVVFLGDVPEMDSENFYGCYSLSVYYPAGNDGWEAFIRQNDLHLTEPIRWVPYEAVPQSGFLASPQSVTVLGQDRATLYAQLLGHGIAYQWQFRASGADSWQDLPQETSPRLMLWVGGNIFGEYRCKAAEQNGKEYFTEAAAVTNGSPVCLEYSRKQVDDTIRYLEEVYSQYPQLGLRIQYGTQQQIAEQRALALAIADGCKTQHEIVRADFDWIRRNFVNSDEEYPPVFPADALQKREANCMTYLQMFNMLCRLQGIPCAAVTGFIADLSQFTYPELLQFDGHGWNYVYVDGQWALVDVGWNQFLITDRDTIAKQYFHSLVDGVLPVDTRPQIDIPAAKYYINGAFTEIWEGENGTLKAGQNMSLNRALNYIPAQIADSFDARRQVAAQIGWNVYENQIYISGTLVEKNGILFHEDGMALAIDPEDFTLQGGFLQIDPGYSGQILAPQYGLFTTWQEFGEGSSFAWSSSDESVLTVDENGVVNAVGVGAAYLSVNSWNSAGRNRISGAWVIVDARKEPDLHDSASGHTHSYKTLSVPGLTGFTAHTCTAANCADTYLTRTDRTYRISYVLNGGTNHSGNPAQYTPGNALPLNAPRKGCYDFLGWYTDAAFTKRITEIAANASADVTLYAKWGQTQTHSAVRETVPGEPATCTGPGMTAELVCNNCGEVVQKRETIPQTPHGESVEVFPAVAPTCELPGYTAEFCCKLCGNVVQERVMIPPTGHGKPVQFVPAAEPTCTEPGSTAGFACEVCGVIMQEAQIIPALGHDLEYIELIPSQPGIPGQLAHNLCHRCGGVFDPTTGLPLSSLEIPDGQLPIIYLLNGGINNAKNLSSYQLGSGETFILYPPTKAGAKFDGWILNGNKLTTSPALPVKIAASFMEKTQSITLEACWTPYVCNVSFNLNGVKVAAVPAMKGVSNPVELPEISADGYRFLGWNTKADGSGTAYPAGEPVVLAVTKNNAGIILYAQWEYDIFFNPMGGTGTMPGQSLRWMQTNVLPASQFTKDGYSFAGWALTQSAAEKGSVKYKDSAKVKNLTPGKVLYAVWKGKPYTVSFDPNGGTGKAIKPQKLTWAKPTALKANTFKNDGLLFTGWSIHPDAERPDYRNKEKPATIPGTQGGYSEALTLYAVWRETYTVHFDPNGGKGTMKDQSLPQGVDWALNSGTFKKTGYTLAGWSDRPEGDVVWENKEAVTDLAQVGQTVTLYAVWKQPCTVTFNANGGKGKMEKLSFWWGEEAVLPANGFTKTGKTFRGWCLSKSGTGTLYSQGEAVTEVGSSYKKSVTLYAIWE